MACVFAVLTINQSIKILTGVLRFNKNFIYHNMSPRKYEADIFLESCIPASKFASLEQNCCFFRTQLSHHWNTTAKYLEYNVLAMWREVGLQHDDRSNYNIVTILIR